jgi:hypothetical protein
MVLSGRNANTIVSGSPTVHSMGTHLSPSVDCDHTKSRSFLSASARHLDPSLVPFRNRHRICSPQGSLLRNLDTSMLILYVNHLSFLMVFPEHEAPLPLLLLRDRFHRLLVGLLSPTAGATVSNDHHCGVLACSDLTCTIGLPGLIEASRICPGDCKSRTSSLSDTSLSSPARAHRLSQNRWRL